MLVQARDEDGDALTAEDLRDDLFTLIGAGHETTAAAIAWGAALLAHDPAVRERATAAAREDDERTSAPSSRRCCASARRIPVAAGRVLDEPFAIGPHTIPADTLILIDAWGVHHDPELYPDPERFQPERFLDQRARALHLAAVRRRCAPLHRLGARRARDQGRARDDPAHGPIGAARRRARAPGPPRSHDRPARRRAHPDR